MKEDGNELFKFPRFDFTGGCIGSSGGSGVGPGVSHLAVSTLSRSPGAFFNSKHLG